MSGNWGQGTRSSLPALVPPSWPSTLKRPSAGHLQPGPTPCLSLVSSWALSNLIPDRSLRSDPVIAPLSSQSPGESATLLLGPSSPPGCLTSISPATLILDPVPVPLKTPVTVPVSNLQAFAWAVPAGYHLSPLLGSFLCP